MKNSYNKWQNITKFPPFIEGDKTVSVNVLIETGLYLSTTEKRYEIGYYDYYNKKWIQNNTSNEEIEFGKNAKWIKIIGSDVKD